MKVICGKERLLSGEFRSAVQKMLGKKWTEWGSVAVIVDNYHVSVFACNHYIVSWLYFIFNFLLYILHP
jgi:hypothetical protein